MQTETTTDPIADADAPLLERTNLSAFYPYVTADEWANAVALAESLTAQQLPCDAEDVLIATSLSRFGEHTLTNDPKTFKTPATEQLFDPANRVGLGSLIVLAKMVKRLQLGVYENCDEIGMDLVQTMTVVVASLTRPKRKLKHRGG